MLKELLDWTIAWANTPYGPLALLCLAFIESFFFPVAPDLLLIPLTLIKPSTAFYLASITTLGSVLGGMFGYLLGLRCGLPILKRFVSEEKIQLVHDYFLRYEAWVIFIAGFTPIPYKVFTISAGVFMIDFKIFVLASLVGRGGRFFILATILFIFGRKIIEEIKYLNLFSIAFVVLVILLFYSVRYILNFLKKGLNR